MESKTNEKEIKKIEELILNKAKNKGKLNVLVYGTDVLHYESRNPGFQFESDKFRVFFHHLANSECPEFKQFDIIIISSGVFISSSGSPYIDELIRRKKETFEFFKKKNTTACFLMPVRRNPLIELEGLIQYSQISDIDLVVDILSRNGIYLETIEGIKDEIKINRGEFKNFIENYCVSDTHLSHSSTNIPIVICSYADNGGNERVVGLAIKSKLILLPHHFQKGDYSSVKEFYETLINCIISFKAKLYFETPEWLLDYQFEQETRLDDLRRVISDNIITIENEIENFQEYKRVLYFGDDYLKDTVKQVLQDGFKFDLQDIEEVKEDLSILDDKGQPLVLIEIKGLNNNVQRGDIDQLDSHREKNDLNENFPALLIANTFMKSNSLDNKNQAIHPNIIKKAVQDKILMMRTLDLLGVLNLKLTNRITSSDFLELLTSNKYGWLFVEDKKLCVKSE